MACDVSEAQRITPKRSARPYGNQLFWSQNFYFDESYQFGRYLITNIPTLRKLRLFVFSLKTASQKVSLLLPLLFSPKWASSHVPKEDATPEMVTQYGGQGMSRRRAFWLALTRKHTVKPNSPVSGAPISCDLNISFRVVILSESPLVG